jgi:hypothetical protein
MSLKPALCALAALFAVASATAAARTWTASDGRTIEAEYISTSAEGESIILARADTGARVTVPLSMLSADDQEHAASLGKKASASKAAAARTEYTSDAGDAVAALAAALPTKPTSQHLDAIEWVRRYEARLKGLSSGDIAANCRALRLQIERDTPVVKEALDIAIKPAEIGTEAARKKQAKHEAAREILAWFGKLTSHATKVEAAAKKAEAMVAQK